jgi:ABC-type xylose transport system substrate-binding protein
MWGNKMAIFTITSRSIDEAIVLNLAKKDVTIGISYFEDETGRNISDTADVLKEVESFGSNGILLSADILRRDQVNKTIDEFLSHFKKYTTKKTWLPRRGC